MNLGAIWAMTKAFTKAFFRNKVALFFTFLFPLVFLVVFGFIFGRDSTPNFEIGLINNSETELGRGFQEYAEATGIISFQTEGDREGFETKLGRGEVDALIILPEDFGSPDASGLPTGELQLFYNQNDEQLGLAITSVLESVFDELNESLLPTNQPLKIAGQPLQTAGLSRLDYVFAGLVGFSILSLGIFSMSEGFMQDKKSKALLRIRLAPIRSWQLIVATIANRVIVGLIAIALMFVAGKLIFGFDMRGDYLSLLLFSIISLVCMLGFGTAIAGWAQNANQSSPVANLISFPMMFLSGVFFPVFLMPVWLQQITAFIPLTAIVDGLRLITTEGQTIFDLGPQLLIVAVWTAVLYAVATKTFRWE
ncbi:ABC transporter permease [Candidatus Saccharibacteria bacterium]|nr:ABC transporter permease [Candidatus Saccharibacteria bacterium]